VELSAYLSGNKRFFDSEKIRAYFLKHNRIDDFTVLGYLIIETPSLTSLLLVFRFSNNKNVKRSIRINQSLDYSTPDEMYYSNLMNYRERKTA